MQAAKLEPQNRQAQRPEEESLGVDFRRQVRLALKELQEALASAESELRTPHAQTSNSLSRLSQSSLNPESPESPASWAGHDLCKPAPITIIFITMAMMRTITIDTTVTIAKLEQ